MVRAGVKQRRKVVHRQNRRSAKRRARREVLRLLAVATMAIVGALGFATIADAQKRPERPKHMIAGELVEEPDMSALPGEVQPDGSIKLDPNALIGVVGADGKPMRNPDGSLKKVKMSEGVPPGVGGPR